MHMRYGCRRAGLRSRAMALGRLSLARRRPYGSVHRAPRLVEERLFRVDLETTPPATVSCGFDRCLDSLDVSQRQGSLVASQELSDRRRYNPIAVQWDDELSHGQSGFMSFRRAVLEQEYPNEIRRRESRFAEVDGSEELNDGTQLGFGFAEPAELPRESASGLGPLSEAVGAQPIARSAAEAIPG